MTEWHAIFHKIESTHCQKVIINATFTSLMSSMPSHSLCYAKLVQHRFVTSLILNFSEKMFCFCNVNLNNFESSKYQNKFWRNIRVENNAGIRVHFKHSDICRIKISWSVYPRMSISRKEEENFSHFTHLYKQRHTKM